jgi:hypothetical protein
MIRVNSRALGLVELYVWPRPAWVRTDTSLRRASPLPYTAFLRDGPLALPVGPRLPRTLRLGVPPYRISHQ